MPPVRTPGNIGPHRESHEPSLLAHLFIDLWKVLDPDKHAAAPDPNTGYREWDGTHGIVDWRMDCNGPDSSNPPAYPNGLGNCGAAATDHGNMAKSGNAQLYNTLGQPKYAGTVPTYFAYGVAMGEVGQSSAPADEPDFGVANNTWLHFLWQNEIIDGYVEIPLADLDLYAPIGSGLLTGVQLPDAAQQEFANHQPWDGSPNPQLGHDTWLIQTHTDGGIALVTWGAAQQCTLNFRQNNITDLWLITDKDDPRVNDTALQAALQALSGTGTV
jgi:hypothetical protein